MIDISVSGLVKSFESDQNILNDITFQVNEGEHVGLLGRNGAGKTTLFKILSGELDYEQGQVTVAGGKRLGLISQIPVYPAGYTVEQVLRCAFDGLAALLREMEDLSRRMADDASPQILRQYGECSARFEAAGGYETDTALGKVCNGLEIPSEMRRQLFDSLSGGEKTRVNLARLILEDTDILLLDEPTNHLDMHAVEWLEDYLSHFKGTVLAISHDRYFLDRVITRVIEVENGKAEFYNGNYSFYVQEKEARYLEQLKKYEQEQVKIAQLSTAAERMHGWGMGNAKLQKRAFAMDKRVERIRQTDRPTKQREMEARFQSREFHGDEAVLLKGVSKHFGGKELFREVDLLAEGGERIALIGDNGTGKTTLIKMLLGEELPDAGKIKLGPSVRFACLPQVIHFNHPERTLADTMIYELDCTAQTARNRLAAFRFPGEDAFKLVSQLSGGEQSRLRLCMLMDEKINFLILDEPTNHLDIQSREWIEQAVEEFEGNLLFVSHDRYFINRFATRIWELENQGVTDFEGSFEQYRAWKAREEKQKQQIKETPHKTGGARKHNKSQPDPLAACEKEIAAWETRQRELAGEMEGAAYDYNKLGALHTEMTQLEEKLSSLYESWQLLAERKEKMP